MRYKVLRKCYYRNRLYSPDIEPVVEINEDPKKVPRHFEPVDKKAAEAAQADSEASAEEKPPKDSRKK